MNPLLRWPAFSTLAYGFGTTSYSCRMWLRRVPVSEIAAFLRRRFQLAWETPLSAGRLAGSWP